jgi:hypothetical protein
MVIPTDVYDDEGNLKQIEFYNMAGSFVVQAVWDENEEQTSDNRVKFREWAYRMVEQTGEEVVK